MGTFREKSPFFYGDAPEPTFRTSLTGYRAKDAVCLFERELLHPADEAAELAVVADPLLTPSRLSLREPDGPGLAPDLVRPLVVRAV